MTTKFICLDGPDGGGHSTHTNDLAAALRAQGIDAREYHHEVHPDGATGLARVVHYEHAREPLRVGAVMRDGRPCVVVMDRGPWSGLVHALALEAADTSCLDSGRGVAVAELVLWWQGLPVVLLDASDATLDARLLLRGEDPAASHGERAQWRRLAAAEGWPVVSTDRPRDVVAADLLALALRVLA